VGVVVVLSKLGGHRKSPAGVGVEQARQAEAASSRDDEEGSGAVGRSGTVARGGREASGSAWWWSSRGEGVGGVGGGLRAKGRARVRRREEGGIYAGSRSGSIDGRRQALTRNTRSATTIELVASRRVGAAGAVEVLAGPLTRGGTGFSRLRAGGFAEWQCQEEPGYPRSRGRARAREGGCCRWCSPP
jgi:hypothetical protein